MERRGGACEGDKGLVVRRCHGPSVLLIGAYLSPAGRFKTRDGFKIWYRFTSFAVGRRRVRRLVWAWRGAELLVCMRLGYFRITGPLSRRAEAFDTLVFVFWLLSVKGRWLKRTFHPVEKDIIMEGKKNKNLIHRSNPCTYCPWQYQLFHFTIKQLFTKNISRELGFNSMVVFFFLHLVPIACFVWSHYINNGILNVHLLWENSFPVLYSER